MLPTIIKPMLAVAAREPFDSEDYLFEIKWDGIRCLAFIESGRVRLQSRRFLDVTAQFPELGCLRGLPNGTVLDGEIVVLKEGRPSFSQILQRSQLMDRHRIELLSQLSPVTLMVFDILYTHGRSLMSEALMDRRRRLREIVGKLSAPNVLITDCVAGNGRALFRLAMRLGLEGVMAKRKDGRYQTGKRSRMWIKIKPAAHLS